MADTGARTLRLLALLQTHRHWAGPELAERLDVSPRTLRRDVDRLRELGYPVDALRGAQGGYRLAPGAALPPLILEDEEAVALTVALLGMTAGPVAGTPEAAARALAKVIQVMPKRLRRRAEAVRIASEPMVRAGPAVDADVLAVTAQACRDSVLLDFAYTRADGACTQRRVEPHRLVPVERRWYLVAYDRERQDWRSFRLDRMSRPTSAAPFAPRRLPGGDAARLVRAGLTQAPRTHTISAEVDAAAGRVRERIGRWAQVSELDAARCHVLIRSDSLDWAMIGLVNTGAQFRILEPPEFADYLRDLAARFRRAVT